MFFCVQQNWNNIAVLPLVAVQLRNGGVRHQNGIQGEGQAASCVSADKSEAVYVHCRVVLVMPGVRATVTRLWSYSTRSVGSRKQICLRFLFE